MCLTHSWQTLLSYRNQFIDLQSTEEVSGVVASLNAFVHDIVKVLFVQDLVLEKKKKRKIFINVKKILIKGLSRKSSHHT